VSEAAKSSRQSKDWAGGLIESLERWADVVRKTKLPPDRWSGQLGGDSLFHRQSSYDRDKASFQPHYLKIFSLRFQIETQLTPTCYGASIRLEQKQDKALSLYLHAADDLTVKQVDKRTLALRQEGETETTKNPLILFTALQMNTDILAVSQEGGDWRIDLTDSHADIQLATSFISPSQALLNLPQKDFDSCMSP